jgi:hypothetical protein
MIHEEIITKISQQLKETNPVALKQLEGVVSDIGPEQAQKILHETLEIEAEGGMTIMSGKRRRTPGGVFLHIAKERVSDQARKAIWPDLYKLNWEDRLTIIPELLEQKGAISIVKIKLVGRPGKIVEKNRVVLTSMQSSKPPSLPKGLPIPPPNPTTYVVYIAARQWQGVKESIQNPDDALIVDGYPFFDKRLGAMAVFAQSVTTKLIQAARREEQKSKIASED